MKHYLLAGAAAFGLAANAQAFEADDIEILIGNLGPASEVFADGLADTLDVLAEEQSAVLTSNALGDTLVDSGSALVAGTSQDGLSLGLLLVNAGAQASLQPYLAFLDDPDPDAFDTVFNPDDLETIAGNLEPAMDALIEGDGFGGGDHGNGLRAAGIELLQGNLGESGGLGPSDGAALYAFTGAGMAAFELAGGTNYQTPAEFLVISALIGLIAAGPAFDAYNDPFGTLFEAAEPVTEPLIEAIAEF